MTIKEFLALGVEYDKSGDHYRANIAFAAARIIDSLTYSRDMTSSTVLCIEDAISLLNTAIEGLKRGE